MASGLSLLLVRPSILLSSLHHLVLSLAFTLAGQQPSDPSSSRALTQLFGDLSAARSDLDTLDGAQDELLGELTVNQEVLDKVRGMESKLEYQIKKLTALAEAEEKRGKEVVEDAEEGESRHILLSDCRLTVPDPLSFRPNISALASTSTAAAAEGSSRRGQRAVERNDDDEEGAGELYRPPRVAAMPYNESSTKSRKERRAPALLSEFASTLEGAPGLETTSGLSTNPVRADRHSNSASAKRAAELKRINEFEEENMTRLVTTKREAKRRREDEEALALGYGVGGSGRNRGNRQNGLEAELEGVLGERRSGGIWDGVGKKLGGRGDMFERGKKGLEARGDGPKVKKARFDKDVKGRSGKRGPK